MNKSTIHSLKNAVENPGIPLWPETTLASVPQKRSRPDANEFDEKQSRKVQKVRESDAEIKRVGRTVQLIAHIGRGWGCVWEGCG